MFDFDKIINKIAPKVIEVVSEIKAQNRINNIAQIAGQIYAATDYPCKDYLEAVRHAEAIYSLVAGRK